MQMPQFATMKLPTDDAAKHAGGLAMSGGSKDGPGAGAPKRAFQSLFDGDAPGNSPSASSSPSPGDSAASSLGAPPNTPPNAAPNGTSAAAGQSGQEDKTGAATQDALSAALSDEASAAGAQDAAFGSLFSLPITMLENGLGGAASAQLSTAIQGVPLSTDTRAAALDLALPQSAQGAALNLGAAVTPGTGEMLPTDFSSTAGSAMAVLGSGARAGAMNGAMTRLGAQVLPGGAFAGVGGEAGTETATTAGGKASAPGAPGVVDPLAPFGPNARTNDTLSVLSAGAAPLAVAAAQGSGLAPGQPPASDTPGAIGQHLDPEQTQAAGRTGAAEATAGAGATGTAGHAADLAEKPTHILVGAGSATRDAGATTSQAASALLEDGGDMPRASTETGAQSAAASPSAPPALGPQTALASGAESGAGALGGGQGGGLGAGLGSEVAGLAADGLLTDARAGERMAQTATGTVFHRPETPGQIAMQIANAVAAGGKPVTEMTLQPEELGRLRMTMSTENGGVSLALTVERPETLDLVRRHIEGLVEDLKRLGYASVDVSLQSGGDGQGEAQSETAQRGQPGAPHQQGDILATDALDLPGLRAQPVSATGAIDIRL